MIVRAHRLSTIINSDEILVMKEGKIIEKGNHNELISQNSVYKTMWEKQTIVFNQSVTNQSFVSLIVYNFPFMLKKVFCISLLSIGVLGFSQKKWTIQECVDYAIKNNLQIQAQAYNKDVQTKNLEIAKRDYLPSVSRSLGTTASFGNTQFVNTSVRNDNFSKYYK